MRTKHKVGDGFAGRSSSAELKSWEFGFFIDYLIICAGGDTEIFCHQLVISEVVQRS